MRVALHLLFYLTPLLSLIHIEEHSFLFQVNKSHKIALQIITYVGCGLSLIGVTLTVFIITAFSYVPLSFFFPLARVCFEICFIQNISSVLIMK